MHMAVLAIIDARIPVTRYATQSPTDPNVWNYSPEARVHFNVTIGSNGNPTSMGFMVYMGDYNMQSTKSQTAPRARSLACTLAIT